MMKRQRGNILFLILLAVVLFAALSYAVTSSTQGGGKNAGDESAQALTSELNNYFVMIDAAIQRMMLTGGVKDYELSFYNYFSAPFFYGYNNANCTSAACQVFSTGGGNATRRDFKSFMRPSADYAARLYVVSVPGAGSDKADLVMVIFGVKSELCLELNKRAGITTPLNAPRPSANASSFPSNESTYASTPSGPFADTTSTLNVSPEIGSTGTFCACGASTWASCLSGYDPSIWHVLVAR